MAKCPFYFELEENFISRAGIAPKITNYELFGFSSDSDNGSNEEDSYEDSANTPSKKKSSLDRRSSAKKANKKSKVSGSGKKNRAASTTNSLDDAMTLFVRDTLERRKKNDEVSQSKAATIALLAEQYNRTAIALGSGIRAAYSCSEFEQFLSPEEKLELAEYKVDQKNCEL
jgi:hypothetical protein